MPEGLTALLDSLRRPEYTGDNRCLPCTAVNVVVGILAGAAVAVVTGVELGAAVLLVALLAIYLRGYLVPYTPTLTKRYFPDQVLALFDKHPHEERRTEETVAEETVTASDGGNTGGSTGAGDDSEYQFETVERIERERQNKVDPERFLHEEGIVVPCEEIDDLCFADSIAETVDDRLAGLRRRLISRQDVADLVGVDVGRIELKDRDYPAIKIRRRIRKWPSKAALMADLATHQAILEQSDRWMDVPLDQRLEMLEGLRAFQEACPLCMGEVALGEETVESCCRSYEVYAIGCQRCGEPLVEFGPDEIDSGQTDKEITP